MTPFLELAFTLAAILLTAKLAGALSARLGQPAVLGEILVGILLGPSLLNIEHLPFITEPDLLVKTIHSLAELGVLLLMFLAGLELHVRDLARNTKVSFFAGTLGVLFPVLMGFGAGMLLKMPFEASIFLGLTLGATSVSISAQTLMELNVLRGKVGLGLLGAAVFDDVLVILLLSTFLAIESGSAGANAILLVMAKMFVYLLGSVAFGLWVLPRLARRVSRLPVSQGMVTFGLVILLTYGLAAEILGGMAAITGAFLAGLMFSRTPEKAQLDTGFRAIAYSFFVPIFFVNIGLSVNIRELGTGAIWVLLLISVIAVAGKIIGAGLGAKISKYSWLESLQLGIGMVSRGEVGLIVARVGLTQGLLSQQVFSAIIGMVLISTILTPPLLRLSFSHPHKSDPSPSQETPHKQEAV